MNTPTQLPTPKRVRKATPESVNKKAISLIGCAGLSALHEAGLIIVPHSVAHEVAIYSAVLSRTVILPRMYPPEFSDEGAIPTTFSKADTDGPGES